MDGATHLRRRCGYTAWSPLARRIICVVVDGEAEGRRAHSSSAPAPSPRLHQPPRDQTSSRPPSTVVRQMLASGDALLPSARRARGSVVAATPAQRRPSGTACPGRSGMRSRSSRSGAASPRFLRPLPELLPVATATFRPCDVRPVNSASTICPVRKS
ncbi:hypothetical protein PVAP13_4NG026800 [Panicum virgatum]|uniref:Uncharacterized protein n=1 Tax=Panicum virgatum TaxID=38727 RepID=A0A8T0T3S5_PANVG|nr:hypothetical protein PVAP13_4NG026800 [Panicum virgatum]